jgi:hypothetical protein
LCGLLSNLMGPAIAVLLLPKSEWVERKIWATRSFASLKSAEAPTHDSFGFTCQSLIDNPGDYHCTYPLDRGMDLFLKTTFLASGKLQYISEEGGLSFALNTSDTGPLHDTLRTPSREVMRELKTVINKYAIAAQSSTYQNASNLLSAYNLDSDLSHFDFLLFQNSIQGQISHLGPSIEYSSSCYFDVSEIVLTSDRSVRCYNIPNPDGLNNDSPIELPYPLSDPDSRVSTMCIRHGSGWARATNYTHFDITNPKHGNISVNVYSTDRAVYLDSTNFGCASGGRNPTDSSCDWDGLFTGDTPENLRKTAINPHIVEYVDDKLGITWCQTNAFLKFSNYQYDLSSLTNPLSFVVLDNIGPVVAAEEPLRVHPSWFRAAWSVGLNDLPELAARDATELIVGETKRLLPLKEARLLTRYHQAIMGQVLSLITYEKYQIASSLPTPPSGATATPLLKSFFRTRVWAYGLGSRTSKLGLGVTIAGCVMVLLHLFIVIFTAKRAQREPLDLVVAGLLQKPPNGFSANTSWRNVRFEMDNEPDAEYVLKR